MTIWNEALAAQFTALSTIRKVRETQAALKPWQLTADKAVNFEFDRYALEHAQCYVWMNPAQAAVQAAAETILTDVPLRLDDIPPGNGNGWWYFTPVMPIPTNGTNAEVAALLWGISGDVSNEIIQRELDRVVQRIGAENFGPDTEIPIQIDMGENPTRVEIAFTVYVRQPGDPATKLWPSTMWHWRIGESIDAMLERNGTAHEALYGPGGKMEGLAALGWEGGTRSAVEAMSRFFLAATTWIQQDIIVKTPGGTRQVRRAIQREYKLEAPPEIQLIALRHTHYERDAPSADAPHAAHRDWSCHWTVSGHWRKQHWGPGNMMTRVRYINPFVKGDTSKPYKPPTKKVFVVMK